MNIQGIRSHQMKLTSIAASIAPLALIITGLANADDERLLEQGNSIYFCETPEDANGLAETYSTKDDIPGGCRS